MYVSNTKKTYVSNFVAIVLILTLVLTALPMQAAHAASAGFSAPSTYSKSALKNANNAYASDNQYAEGTGNNKSAEYGNFEISIPAGATINLVEVSVEGHGTKNWKVAVSKNNGTSYSAYTTVSNTGSNTDAVTVTAGTGTLWGLTGWTAASFSNANFKVKIATGGGPSNNVAYLDQLTVRVTYTPVSAVATTLVMATPAAGTYGGSVNLQATLTTGGSPLTGKSVTFSLDGFSRGSATTNASGVATLSNVTLTTGLSNTLLHVGSYVVGASFAGDDTYAFSTDTDTQTVNPMGITVNADAKTRVYGSNDPALTYTSQPALVGTDAFSGELVRSAGENVGSYAINQGTLALSPNYTITYVGANLSITALPITIKADNKAIKTGNADPQFTYSVSELIGSDTLTTQPVCGVSVPHAVAGSYPIVCEKADAGSNYTIGYVNGTLTVSDKDVLTVTALPQTKVYGSADPTFGFTYSGFVGNDTNITGTAPICGVNVPHANVGSYPAITCSGGLDDKYEFSYVSGTLTVTPRAVSVIANPQTKTYGASDPVLTYVFAPPLVSGDGFIGSLARSAGEDVGSYAISQGSLTPGSNYTVSFTGANMSITRATLTVTADDQTVPYSFSDPAFTFQYSDFVNGDDAGDINTAPTCGVLVTHTSVGTYPIVCQGGADNNYSFSYIDGTLSVVMPSQSFADVLPSHPYFVYIEVLYRNGLTGGCATNPLKYCPDQIMNRGQAAVFILRANSGSSYVPPAATHIFQDDWSKGTWAEPWAEAMRNEGLSAGCLTSPLKYCPWDQIPREQAVIFALRMKYGTLYTPPPATGTVFADMTNTGYYATPWAEQAYKEGIIQSCGISGGKPNFCPKNLVTRGLAAYMIVKAKNLTLP